MNDYFDRTDDIIYIDAGIEGVFMPSEQPQDQWSTEELKDHIDSGYSGQIVVGLKKRREGDLTASKWGLPYKCRRCYPSVSQLWVRALSTTTDDRQ